MKIAVNKAYTFSGHRDCIYSISHQEVGRSFFSASGDGQVVRWDLNTPDVGQLVAQLSSSIYSLSFLPETNQLLIGQNFGGIHLIDLSKKKEINNLALGNSAVFDLVKNGNMLFAATGSGEIVQVDISILGIKSVIKLSDKSARALAINPMEGHLAAAFSDHTIRILDLGSMKVIHEIKAHDNSVFTLAYTPDYRRLISAGRDARLKSWEVATGYTLNETVAAHMYAINHLCFSPSGRYFATGSMDKTVKIWDTNEMKLLKVVDKVRHAGHGTSVNKVLWGKTDELLISCGDDRTISIWQLEFNTSL